MNLSIYQSINLSTNLSTYLPIDLSIYLSNLLYLYQCICTFMHYALCICTFMHHAYVHLCIMHMLFVWLVCAYMCTHVYNPWTFNSRRIFFNRWTYEGIHGSSDTDTTAMEYLVQHCACVISDNYYHMGKHDEKYIHVAYLYVYI